MNDVEIGRRSTCDELSAMTSRSAPTAVIHPSELIASAGEIVAGGLSELLPDAGHSGRETLDDEWAQDRTMRAHSGTIETIAMAYLRW